MNSTKNLDLHEILDLTTKQVFNFKIEPLLINGVPLYLVSGLVVDKNNKCHEYKAYGQDLGIACCRLLVKFAPILELNFDINYSGKFSINVLFQLNQQAIPLFP